jgi:hypothetical protein
VPLLVEANVQPAVSLSASSFNLGKEVKLGEAVTRRVVIKGTKPFKVLGVEGLGDDITIDLPKEAAPQHILAIKCQFTKAGDFKRELKIKTDLQEAPLIVTVEGSAVK